LIGEKMNSNFAKQPGRLSDQLFIGKIPSNHTFMEPEEGEL
jgi:hypothetical protein